MKAKALAYPAIFAAEPEGECSISFPDFPEAHSQGEDFEDAFRMATGCLHAVIEWRMEEKLKYLGPRPYVKTNIRFRFRLTLLRSWRLLISCASEGYRT